MVVTGFFNIVNKDKYLRVIFYLYFNCENALFLNLTNQKSPAVKQCMELGKMCLKMFK